MAAWNKTALLAVLLLPACTFDWDKLDPALGSGSGGDGGGTTSTGTAGGCADGDQVACYDGPEGTRDVGVCRAGKSTCEGGIFGPCAGAIVPVAEDCNTSGDDDCDGEANEVEEGCMCQPGELRACYDGPMGTAGVGACVAGEKMCLPAGNEFTLCYGDIVPRFEDCHTPADDDCDGTSNEDCATWAKGWEASSHAMPGGLALDSNGHVVMGGAVDGDIDFDGIVLPGNGDYDIVALAISTADGSVAWANRWGDASAQFSYATAADGQGNTYVAGVFDGTLDFGVNTLISNGGQDAFVVKIDAGGDPVWARQFGDAALQEINGIAADDVGNVVITGGFEGNIDLDVLQATANARDGFVAKLDGTGAVTWAKTFGGVDNDQGLSVTFDGTDIVLGGYFDDEISFGGALVTDLGDDEGFIAKLDGDGNQQWIHPIGPGGNQYVHTVAVAPNGSIFGTGRYDGSVDLGAGALNATDYVEAFVIALDTDGNPLWGHVYNGWGWQSGEQIAADADGNAWLTVYQDDAADYGGGEIRSYGNGDIALVKLDPNGNYLHAARLGGFEHEEPRGAAVDAAGNFYVTGHAEGDLDFGTGWIDTYGGWFTVAVPQ